jgi:hypothetical protein
MTDRTTGRRRRALPQNDNTSNADQLNSVDRTCLDLFDLKLIDVAAVIATDLNDPCSDEPGVLFRPRLRFIED